MDITANWSLIFEQRCLHYLSKMCLKQINVKRFVKDMFHNELRHEEQNKIITNLKNY